MKIGYIGLGKMGKNMVLRLLENGIEVVAWNRSPEPLDEVANAGAIKAGTIEDLADLLPSPRIVWLMLPAGEVIDEFIDKLSGILTKDDLVIDGGNSFYKDTLRRGKKFAVKKIHYMDIGVSGGPNGARNGACMMIGGEKSDYEKMTELVSAACSENAFGYFGPLGSGHFAKMVHNGIEYGMMQSIAEGAAILKQSKLGLDIAEVFRVYNNRSVIESRLVGWAEEAFKEDPELIEISSKIDATGEGEWTVKTAKEMKIKVPVIQRSFEVRQGSVKIDPKSSEGYRNKVVSVLREKFGQHKVRIN
jgi:6-phosphogluconate dehydrogenase